MQVARQGREHLSGPSKCRMLKENCLLFCTDSLDFVEAARRFRGHLPKMRREATKQTNIDMFFNYK